MNQSIQWIEDFDLKLLRYSHTEDVTLHASHFRALCRYAARVCHENNLFDAADRIRRIEQTWAIRDVLSGGDACPTTTTLNIPLQLVSDLVACGAGYDHSLGIDLAQWLEDVVPQKIIFQPAAHIKLDPLPDPPGVDTTSTPRSTLEALAEEITLQLWSDNWSWPMVMKTECPKIVVQVPTVMLHKSLQKANFVIAVKEECERPARIAFAELLSAINQPGRFFSAAALLLSLNGHP